MFVTLIKDIPMKLGTDELSARDEAEGESREKKADTIYIVWCMTFVYSITRQSHSMASELRTNRQLVESLKSQCPCKATQLGMTPNGVERLPAKSH